MIKRELSKKLKILFKKFPIVGIFGPRQSGKTTLARETFDHLVYVNLENLDVRQFAEEDPRGFLALHPKGMIIDEVQYVPHLFSYLQTISDERQKVGQYILTGSQNFLLSEKVSQSLAGRIAITTLLPIAYEEIMGMEYAAKNLDRVLWRGLYPRVLDKKINPLDFYPNYIQTYLERDVRQIKNISDINLFQKFLKLCAARVGQLLNFSSLANDCGVSHVTIRQWIGILEMSYIIFLLRPFHKNFGKRIMKSPKLYFVDTALACSLLEIQSENQLSTHYARGSLFENWVIGEYIKSRYNRGLPRNAYFWRDHIGNEVDLILEEGGDSVPIEIKSGSTLNSDYYNGLKYYTQLGEGKLGDGALVYGGDMTFNSKNGRTIGWENLPQLWK